MTISNATREVQERRAAVAQYLADGYTQPRIAAILFCSLSTVEKDHAHNRHDADYEAAVLEMGETQLGIDVKQHGTPRFRSDPTLKAAIERMKRRVCEQYRLGIKERKRSE